MTIASLESNDWRKRKQAIEELRNAPPEELPSKLLAIIRENYRNLSALNAALQLLSSLREDVLPGLFRLAEDPNPEIRAYAVIALSEQGSPQAIPVLIRAISDTDPNVRFNAVEAIGKYQAIEAIEPLLGILHERDFYLSFAALEALVKIGSEVVVEDIADLLEDEILGSAAVAAIGKLGNLSSVPLVVRWVEAPTGDIATATGALVDLHHRMTALYSNDTLVPLAVAEVVTPAFQKKLLDALQAAVLRASGGTAPPALPALITVAGWLSSHSRGDQNDQAQIKFHISLRGFLVQLINYPALRESVLGVLRQSGKEVVPGLISKLADPDAGVRQAALIALGSIGDVSAVPALIEALDSEENELATLAAGALGKIGDRSAFEPLVKKLAHPSALFRQTAIAALNSLGHPNHTARMMELAGDDNPLIREAAVRMLGYFGDPQSLDTIIRACEDPILAVRLAGLENLSNYDDSRVMDVIRNGMADSSPKIRAASVKALRFSPPDYAVPLLLRAVTDSDMWVRIYACRMMSHFRAPLVEKEIQKLVKDRLPPVRAAAAEVLGSYGHKKAVDILCEMVQDPEKEVAESAVRALAQTHHLAALPLLKNLTIHPSSEMRKLAITALGQHGSEDAVKILRSVLEFGGNPEWVFSSLLHIRNAEAVEIIVRALGQPSYRKTASEYAIQAGNAAVSSLRNLLAHPDCALETKLVVTQVLQRIRTPEATDLLVSLLMDNSTTVRLAVIYALGEIGSISTRKALTEISQDDPEENVRRRAKLALKRLP